MFQVRREKFVNVKLTYNGNVTGVGNVGTGTNAGDVMAVSDVGDDRRR